MYECESWTIKKAERQRIDAFELWCWRRLKGQKWLGPNKAEHIKKSWQEYTEELYKKDLHNPDNHDGVITHLEPDILECKVKWALGSITMNKASGGDGIQLSCFKS